MKKTVILAAAAATLLSGQAFAQSSNAQAQAAALAHSTSAASAGSGVAIINQHATDRLSTTGNAVAPGLVASGLSCAGSSSIGVGFLGGAFSLGTTRMDRDCNTRENAKVIGLSGDVEVAIEIMCGIGEVSEAFKLLGRPCIRDRRVAVSNPSVPIPVSATRADVASAPPVRHVRTSARQLGLSQADLRNQGCELRVNEEHGRHWYCPNPPTR